jgi:nicotinamide phosphoribosyltransferase
MIQPIPDMSDNHALDSDVYKDFHPQLYVPGLDQLNSYLHSRGGRFPVATLFGLQYLLHRYWAKPFTKEHYEEAKEFNAYHGSPFNEAGWSRVLNKHGGYLPIRLRAIPEGLGIPPNHALLTAESTDPEFPSIESFMETSLVRLWQPSTVATGSREAKKLILKYLRMTSDTPEQDIEYMLHDFGGRGVGTKEQARIAGAAHMLSFGGSDTKEGFRCLNHYYSGPGGDLKVPGVAASEHSTVCSWGRGREFEMVDHAINHYLYEKFDPNKFNILSCVADTYDVFEFTRRVTSGPLRDRIKNSGGKFVARPDSGDPLTVLPRLFEIASTNLQEDMAVTGNGFRKLPGYFGFLQGDGIWLDTLEPILKMMVENKMCISNIVFGSGGGLHQMWNRDTQKWAFKASAARANGTWIDDVRKDPITDPGKRSRAGRLDLIRNDRGEFETVDLGHFQDAHPQSVMNTVYENGHILHHNTWQECRERMAL